VDPAAGILTHIGTVPPAKTTLTNDYCGTPEIV
jgi:hypothetical protein